MKIFEVLFDNGWSYEDHNVENSYYETFAEAQNAFNNILKNSKKLFYDRVVSIELNLYFKDAKTLLDIFTKQGYKVKCYYKEIK